MSEKTVTQVPISDVERLQKRAKDVLKSRLAAPVSYGTGDVTIPQQEKLDGINSDQGGKNDVVGGMHRMTIPSADLAGYANRGYAPCINKATGEIERCFGDVYVEIPTEIYLQELAVNTEIDARNCRRQQKTMEGYAENTGAEKAEVPIGLPSAKE